jgi:hypothetical protein
MNETYALSVFFTTDQGKPFTLAINGANPSVDAAAINAAVEEILGAGVLINKNGEPAEAVRATLTRRETEDIEVN